MQIDMQPANLHNIFFRRKARHDIGKVRRTKIFTKKKYFFSSFNNDSGLSLEDKTKDYVDRNTGRVYSLHEVTQIG